MRCSSCTTKYKLTPNHFGPEHAGSTHLESSISECIVYRKQMQNKKRDEVWSDETSRDMSRHDTTRRDEMRVDSTVMRLECSEDAGLSQRLDYTQWTCTAAWVEYKRAKVQSKAFSLFLHPGHEAWVRIAKVCSTDTSNVAPSSMDNHHVLRICAMRPKVATSIGLPYLFAHEFWKSCTLVWFMYAQQADIS